MQVDQEHHQRFLLSAFFVAKILGFAFGIPLHLRDHTFAQVDIDAAIVELNTQGIHQERHILLQHVHHRVRAEPAVFFQGGVEYANFRAFAVVLLDKLPGTAYKARQVTDRGTLILGYRQQTEQFVSERQQVIHIVMAVIFFDLLFYLLIAFVVLKLIHTVLLSIIVWPELSGFHFVQPWNFCLERHSLKASRLASNWFLTERFNILL